MRLAHRTYSVSRISTKCSLVKSKPQQANNGLMSEREEKKTLQKDLGKILNHQCDNAAYKLDALKIWDARTLHELEISNEKL